MNFVLQWGSTGGALALAGAARRPRPTAFTFHLPGRAPQWWPVKAAVFFRGWARARPGRDQRFRRSPRWITLGWHWSPPRGWAERAGLTGGGGWAYAAEVHHLHRPEGYDFTRWPFKLRGTLRLPTLWDQILFAEGLLARPRYV